MHVVNATLIVNIMLTCAEKGMLIMTDSKTYELRCSFCAKNQHEVKKLVAGPGIYVCDECIGLCQKFIDDGSKGKKDGPLNPIDYFKTLENAALTKGIAGAERVRGDIGSQQQLIVDILRDRNVSWSDIGQALGVSRQAVWRRFGVSDTR